MTAKPEPKETPKPKRGRPIKKKTPERIPDSPENILMAVLRQPPRREDDWDYLKHNDDS